MAFNCEIIYLCARAPFLWLLAQPLNGGNEKRFSRRLVGVCFFHIFFVFAVSLHCTFALQLFGLVVWCCFCCCCRWSTCEFVFVKNSLIYACSLLGSSCTLWESLFLLPLLRLLLLTFAVFLCFLATLFFFLHVTYIFCCFCSSVHKHKRCMRVRAIKAKKIERVLRHCAVFCLCASIKRDNACNIDCFRT